MLSISCIKAKVDSYYKKTEKFFFENDFPYIQEESDLSFKENCQLKCRMLSRLKMLFWREKTKYLSNFLFLLF